MKNDLRFETSIMQDFFFLGMISAIALGVFLIKTILFYINIRNAKTTNDIIQRNLDHIKQINHQTQQLQNNANSIEIVANWRTEDLRPADDLRHQFLTKTKTRRTTPTISIGGRVSPRERVPLATADFGADDIDNDEANDLSDENSVPIYTFNPSIGGTQV